MALEHRRHLGVGWKFPVRITPTGGFAFARYEDSVQEGIWLVLASSRGSRQMRPRFGCGIHDYVFGLNDPATRGSIAHQVRQALSEWEPRIELLDVRVDASSDEENKLLIRVDYRIRSNNTFHNLVYPFYIREGVGT